MMKIWYKLNELDVTMVQVEDGAFVAELKAAIHLQRANMLAAVDAPDLQVFVAGQQNKLLNQSRLCDIIKRPSIVHPLIVKATFPSPPTTIPDQFAPILLDLATQTMANGWAKKTTNANAEDGATNDATSNNDDSPKIRLNARKYYGLSGNDHCQILGASQSQQHVVRNAHVWPRRNRQNLVRVDLAPKHIDHAKNVLRLHQGIRDKLDSFQLTFVQVGEDIVMHVLDPTIKEQMIQETSVTFGDIQGRKLACPSGNKPWKQVLGTHSLLAHRHARINGWLEKEDLTTQEPSAAEWMKWSLDNNSQELIQRQFKRPRDSDQPPGINKRIKPELTLEQRKAIFHTLNSHHQRSGTLPRGIFKTLSLEYPVSARTVSVAWNDLRAKVETYLKGNNNNDDDDDGNTQQPTQLPDWLFATKKKNCAKNAQKWNEEDIHDIQSILEELPPSERQSLRICAEKLGIPKSTFSSMVKQSPELSSFIATTATTTANQPQT